jgi:hypothetical protein
MDILKLISNLIDSIKNSPTGVSFVALNNYENSNGQIQNAVINVGLSYERAKAKDIVFLEKLNVFNDKRFEKFEDKKLLEVARLELLASAKEPNAKMSAGQIDAYTYLCAGLKMHNDTKVLFLQGFNVSKKVVNEGETKADVRQPKTKAKDAIRKYLKATKYRQYNLNKLSQMTINKTTLVLE